MGIITGGVIYSTKNGLGDGVLNRTLSQIKTVYEDPTMGDNVVNQWGYINAPSEKKSGTNLGLSTDGVVSAEAIAALAGGCNCNQ